MRSRTQAYSALIAERIAVIAERKRWLKPDGTLNYNEIAGAMTIALGRFYHPMSVSRLLNLERRDLTADEVEAWNELAELDRAKQAEAWALAGIMPEESPVAAILRLLDEREAATAAGDSAFARKQRARRARAGQPTPTADGLTKPYPRIPGQRVYATVRFGVAA